MDARIVATYRLAPAGGPRGAGAEAWARTVAREATLEIPEGVARQALEDALLGRVESVDPRPDGSAHASISYAPELLDEGLPQLLNVIHGNVSLLPGVRLVDLQLPPGALGSLPGPTHGIEGIRRLVAAEEARGLVAAALKPVGRTTRELASLAGRFARAGVDVVKDDHGLADQLPAPFRDRATRIAEAVRKANASTGGSTAYFVNVTGPAESLAERVAFARECGCAGILICPALLGLETVRALVAGGGTPPVMAHPSGADTAPDRDSGIAPDVLFGLLWRAAGADAVIYVNAGGRFTWSVDLCRSVNRRLRGPLGSMRPALPVPAGGVEAHDAGRWLAEYGPDTMLLIGGSLLGDPDLERATRRLVAVARGAKP